MIFLQKLYLSPAEDTAQRKSFLSYGHLDGSHKTLPTHNLLEKKFGSWKENKVIPN